MILVRVFRNDNGEENRYGLPVRCAEGNRLSGAGEQKHGLIDAANARVRERHTVSNCGRSRLLTSPQCVKHRFGVQAVHGAHPHCNDFKRLLPRGNVQVQDNFHARQEIKDASIHANCSRVAVSRNIARDEVACRLLSVQETLPNVLGWSKG